MSEWYFLFSIAHKVTIGFAVIGVINGVFMQAGSVLLDVSSAPRRPSKWPAPTIRS